MQDRRETCTTFVHPKKTRKATTLPQRVCRTPTQRTRSRPHRPCFLLTRRLNTFGCIKDDPMFSPQDHKGSTTSHNGHIGNEEHKPRNGRQPHATCKRKGRGGGRRQEFAGCGENFNDRESQCVKPLQSACYICTVNQGIAKCLCLRKKKNIRQTPLEKGIRKHADSEIMSVDQIPQEEPENSYVYTSLYIPTCQDHPHFAAERL